MRNKIISIVVFITGALAMFLYTTLTAPVGSYSQAMSILSEQGTTFTKEGVLTYTSESEELTFYELKAIGKLSDVYDFINITNYESIEVEMKLYDWEEYGRRNNINIRPEEVKATVSIEFID